MKFKDYLREKTNPIFKIEKLIKNIKDDFITKQVLSNIINMNIKNKNLANDTLESLWNIGIRDGVLFGKKIVNDTYEYDV